MKRVFFWIVLLVAVVGAVQAIRLVFKLQIPLPQAGSIAEPPKGPYAANIGARGLVESVDENVRIAPAIAGLVAEVPVKVGDDVKAGDTLVKQDTRDASAMISAQEAELTALQTQLHEAEVTVADKKDMWNRMQKLIAGRVASDEERQRTQYAVQAAEALLGSMKARIDSAAAMLNRTRVQRDLLTIRAPRDGRVLQVNTRAGEFASPTDRDSMILLGQVDRFQLRADVDEDNASRIRGNTNAVAYVKGRRDVEIPLKFVRIEPYILPKRSLTGESSERVDTRVLQIIYQFERPAALAVYVGQQMDVFIESGSEVKESKQTAAQGTRK
jgi:HlyD family secretion protein